MTHLRNQQLPAAYRHIDVRSTSANQEASLILELITNGESAPAWRANLGSAEPLLQAINSTNKEVIKAVIDQFAAQIEREAIPYFVPANNELLALPAILP